MSRSSPETETLLQEASFAARVDRISSGETKMVYVKRWRTLVELPAKYADEIVEALRTSGVAQQAKEPIDKKALLDIMNGYLVVHARRDGTFEIRGADKAAEDILLVIAHSDTSTDRQGE